MLGCDKTPYTFGPVTPYNETDVAIWMNLPLEYDATSCFCHTKPSPVTDASTGETACGKCGKVLLAKAELLQTADHSMMPGNNMPTNKVKGNSRMKMASKIANKTDSIGVKAECTIVSCCTKLGIPSAIKDDSISLFHKYRPELRGRGTGCMSAAIIYMSCREHSVPRSMLEICDTVNADMKATRKAYKAIHNSRGTAMPVQSSGGFTTRLASDLGVPEKTVRKAFDILDRVCKTGMMAGTNPLMLASGVLYIAVQDDGLQVSQNKMARASGITAVGMRKAVKKIQSVLDDHCKKSGA